MEYSSGEELADEAEQLPKVAAPPPAPPSSEENDLFCWPLTAIVVNIVKEPESGKDVESTEYWMKRFSKYKPEVVEILWDDEKQKAQALVRFNNDWIGFKNAMEFEKAFEADHHSKKEWVAAENSSSSSIYAWLARSNDFESQGPIGDYLRTKRELKTISDLVHEAMVELATQIDMRNEKLEDLQIKCNQKNMSLSRMLEEKDSLQQAFYKEIGNLLHTFSRLPPWFLRLLFFVHAIPLQSLALHGLQEIQECDSIRVQTWDEDVDRSI